MSDRLSTWEDEEQQVPLEELLGSMLENIRQTSGETQFNMASRNRKLDAKADQIWDTIDLFYVFNTVLQVPDDVSPAVTDDDTELFQEEEPTGVDQSKLLRDDLDRCCLHRRSVHLKSVDSV